MLWLEPARDWFDGIAPPKPARSEPTTPAGRRAARRRTAGPRDLPAAAPAPAAELRGAATAAGLRRTPPPRPPPRRRPAPAPPPRRPPPWPWPASSPGCCCAFAALIIAARVGVARRPTRPACSPSCSARTPTSRAERSPTRRSGRDLAGRGRASSVVWAWSAVVLAVFGLPRPRWARIALVVSAGVARCSAWPARWLGAAGPAAFGCPVDVACSSPGASGGGSPRVTRDAPMSDCQSRQQRRRSALRRPAAGQNPYGQPAAPGQPA